MKEVQVNIKSVSFPSQFVSDSEKASLEFGLQVGQAIQYEWFRRDANNGRYYEQWREFHRVRLYARGEQSVEKYKSEIAIDGDLSYMNLDWTPVPIMPKFVDIVVNGMSNRLFSVKAFAQDAISTERRQQFQQSIEGDMAAKDILMKIQSRTGVNAFSVPPEELPQSSEELKLYMQINYKPAIEIAEEEAIDTILNENNYLELRKRIDYDLTTLGIGICKHTFQPGSGIRIEYVDPANCIYSYTEDPNFEDCFYWGEVKTVAINELRKIDPTLTNEELEDIAKRSQSWYDYYNVAQFYDSDTFTKDTATLLYFNYKTTKRFVYKKRFNEDGGVKVIEKDDTFNPPQEMMDDGRFEKVEKVIDVWYDGVMVAGTNIMLKWEMMENMVRPKSASQDARPNYVAVAPRMYKGRLESIGRRMIPFVDQIQITHLKLQQVVARMVPDGVYLDADGLNEIDLGNGSAYSPEEALNLYFQTGSVIGRSYTQEGEFNHGRVPIQPLSGNSSQSKLSALIGNYNHLMTMLRDCTGLNEARDGSTPDPNALVGVQKLAALNSNTATRHVLDGSLSVVKRLAEGVSLRVSDVLEYADHKEEFINQIGKYNVGIIENIAELYLHDFGVFIEVSPDEEEKQQLEANIQMALSKGDINLEDAIDIRGLKNIKLANQLLKVKRKAKQEREDTKAMMQQQMQAEQQMQIQQMAAQASAQKTQMETDSKIAIIQAQSQSDVQKMQGEAQLKMQLMAEEFNYQLQIKSMDVQAFSEREQMKENEKKKRIDRQNSQQSKLINQRKNNLPSMNFESNEDSLDGFDFSEFNPR
jgi:hypothetical protein